MSSLPNSPLDPTLIPPGLTRGPIADNYSHGWSVAFSVLLIVLGVIAVALPNISGVALTLYFGWLLILGGVAFFLLGLRTHASSVRWFQVLLGLLYFVIGITLLLHPVAGLATLTVLLAGYLAVEGVVELLIAFRLDPRAGRGWLVLDGIIALVIALAIITAWPSSTAWAVGTLVGINMIFGGVSRLMVSGAVRRHTSLLGF